MSIRKILNAYSSERKWPQNRLFPEGTKVKINLRKVRKGDWERRMFIVDHIDTVFTIEHDYRFTNKPIYCLVEDTSIPKWLFHESELIKVE